MFMPTRPCCLARAVLVDEYGRPFQSIGTLVLLWPYPNLYDEWMSRTCVRDAWTIGVSWPC